MGLRQHGTQVVICMCRDDTLLSPLASIDLFHPLTGYCHVTAWCLVFVCFLCVCLFFVFVFGVVVAFVSLCFFFLFFDERDSLHWTMYRSSTSLLLRPLQYRPLRDLINQLIPYATCFETC